MIEIIKFIFYILSTGFVVFNILDNILIESIKGRYSKVPGKFSNFGKIMDFLRDIFIFMIIIEYILSLITLFDGHLKVKHNGNIYFFIALIICLEAFFIIFYTFNKYLEVKSIFINALEGNEKADDKNLINKIFSRNKEEWKNKIYKNIKRANLFSNIFNSIYLVFIINSIFKEDLFKYMDIFFNLLILLIVNILASSILSSLKKALQEVIDNKEYILNYGENEYIKTKLYLDYKDEYLIIKDGYEIFIPKSNVKRKVVRTIE